METNTELICCAGCGGRLEITDSEFVKCEACGQLNLLGERTMKALRHIKEQKEHNFNVPVFSGNNYSSSCATIWAGTSSICSYAPMGTLITFGGE